MENHFTSGMGIMRIEGTHSVPPGKEVKVLDTIIKDNLNRDAMFQHWRGQVINNALFVEERVDWLITKLLFKGDVDGGNTFRSIILSREFFGFMSKWKVLKDLLKTLTLAGQKDHSELIKDLHNVIDERDKFAHGQVTYSGIEGEKIMLSYFRDGAKKDEVTEETIKHFIELCSKSRHALDNIIALHI